MVDETDIAIEVTGLYNRFGLHVVHENLDIKVRKGEILGVVGGSGTGKSVLLRSIVGLLEPQAGVVKFSGVDQANLGQKEARDERSRWGVLFQDGALFSSLTVAQNIQVPLREYHNLSEELLNDIAAMKVNMVGLPPNACGKLPSDLSGGMRKRAGIARALALDPKIVFLDEPTAGLDPIGAAAFDNLILKLKNDLGLTVFLVTHDLDTLYTICDRVAVLAERRVLVTDTIENLMEFDHPWVQEYFKGPRARAAQVAEGNISPNGKG